MPRHFDPNRHSPTVLPLDTPVLLPASVDAWVENETIRGLPPRRVCADG